MHVGYSGQDTKDGAGERDTSRREGKQWYGGVKDTGLCV